MSRKLYAGNRVAYNGNDIFVPFNGGLYGIDESDSDRSMQLAESKDSILEAFKREFEVPIKEKLASAGLELESFEYWSPREYNFLTDSIDLAITVKDEDAFRAAMEPLRAKVQAAPTGKHLNWIDGGDKKSRLTEEQFNEALDKMLKHYGISESE